MWLPHARKLPLQIANRVINQAGHIAVPLKAVIGIRHDRAGRLDASCHERLMKALAVLGGQRLIAVAVDEQAWRR